MDSIDILPFPHKTGGKKGRQHETINLLQCIKANQHCSMNKGNNRELTPPLAICVAVGSCVVASPEKLFKYIEEALL